MPLHHDYILYYKLSLHLTCLILKLGLILKLFSKNLKIFSVIKQEVKLLNDNDIVRLL